MKKYKLEDLFDLQMGKTPSRNNSDYWSDGVYDWISIKDLSNSEKYITDTKEKLPEVAVEESGIKPIPENTVVMSFKLSIGKVAITSTTMYSNEAIMAFHDKGVEDILPEYLYYHFLSKDWSDGSNKAVMGITLNKATLSKVEIKLHDFLEQKQIVSILNKCDRLLALKKDELKELDNLIKSRFVEMFGDPYENPMNWPTFRLEELIIKSNNGMSRRGCDEQGNIVLRLVELQDGYIDYSKPNRIKLEESEKSRYLLVDNDFLFARVNGNPEYVGRCAVFNRINEDVYHNDHTIRVHFDESRLEGVFASTILNSHYGKNQMKSQIKTSAGQYTISQSGIGAIVTILPTIDLQHSFVTFVKQVDKLKLVVLKSLEETQLLFDSLMQKYFK